MKKHDNIIIIFTIQVIVIHSHNKQISMQSTQLCSSCRPCKSEHVYCLYITSPKGRMAARPTKSPVFRDSTNRDSEPYSLSQSLQRQPEEVRLTPWNHGTTWEQLWSYDEMWKLIKRSNSIQFLHSLPKPFQHSVWFSVWFSVLSACIFSLYHPWCVFATRILDCRNSRVHSWHSPHSHNSYISYLSSPSSSKWQPWTWHVQSVQESSTSKVLPLLQSSELIVFGKWQDKWVCLKIGYPINIMSYFDFLIVELAILGYPGILYFWKNGNTKMEDAKHEHGKQPKQ